MKRRPALLSFLLLLTALMAGCGFQLRGSTVHDSMPFKSIYVVVPDSSGFGVELKRNLRASEKTRVLSDAKDAEVVLDVLDEKKSKSILSLNVQGRVREYTLNYEIRFRVRDSKSRDVIAPVSLALNRTLIFSETYALARENEEAMLYQEMQTDMVQQIMRRLAAAKLPDGKAFEVKSTEAQPTATQ